MLYRALPCALGRSHALYEEIFAVLRTEVFAHVCLCVYKSIPEPTSEAGADSQVWVVRQRVGLARHVTALPLGAVRAGARLPAS